MFILLLECTVTLKICPFFLSLKDFCTEAFCLILQFWFHSEQQTASRFIHKKLLSLEFPVLCCNKMFFSFKKLIKIHDLVFFTSTPFWCTLPFRSPKKAISISTFCISAIHVVMQPLSLLTFPLFFLSPPKNLPIWSMRPGAFFLRPSPEVPAVAILSVDLLSLGQQSARPANVLLSTALSPLWQHSSKLLNSLWCIQGGWAGLWRCGPFNPGQSLVIRWVCNSVSDSGLVPGILYSLCTLGVSHCPTLCSRRCHCSWPHLPQSCVVHNKACVCESCGSMQNSPQHNQSIVTVIHILYTNNLCWNDIYVPYDIFLILIFDFEISWFIWIKKISVMI